MDYSLSEQQKMLQQSARDFLRKEMPTSLVKEMASHETGHLPQLWGKMAEMGWMALAVPEEYGGCEMTFLDLVVLLEEMGRASLPGPYFSTVVLGTSAVLEAGSEDLKQRLLPGVVSGDILLTVAMAEREAVHDPRYFETKADVCTGGYTLTGTKLFVPDAAVADHIICAAKTAKGIALFLVDRGSPGLTITALPTMAGDKQYEVKFDSVVVPANNVVGIDGEGWRHWQKVQAKAAVAKCAEMIGGAQQAFDLTVTYARDRVQFGRPIGSFQAIQHHCANMYIDVESAIWLTRQAAWMLSEGLHCTKEVSIAKASASEACRRVSALAIQIHGGIGFCWEHDLHLYYKQAKLGETTFGDAAYHEEIVAAELGL